MIGPLIRGHIWNVIDKAIDNDFTVSKPVVV